METVKLLGPTGKTLQAAGKGRGFWKDWSDTEDTPRKSPIWLHEIEKLLCSRRNSCQSTGNLNSGENICQAHIRQVLKIFYVQRTKKENNNNNKKRKPQEEIIFPMNGLINWIHVSEKKKYIWRTAQEPIKVLNVLTHKESVDQNCIGVPSTLNRVWLTKQETEMLVWMSYRKNFLLIRGI